MAPPGAWTITTAGEDEQGDLIDQPSKGNGIGYRLWLDPLRRVLSIDPENATTQRRRLVRCLLRRAFMDRGHCFLHSALVVSRRTGRGLALAGGKRAGKTSLTLAMLKSGEFDYVTNDDLVVNVDEDAGLDAFGWPRAVSIRRGTLRLLANRGSALRQVLEASRHPEQVRTGNPTDRRALLFPDELAQATGASVVAQARLHAVIVPRFDALALSPELEQVHDRQEARGLLRQFVEGNASRQEAWLDRYFTQTHDDELERQAAKLSKRVPVFRLTQSMACLGESAKLLHNLVTEGP
ncbi:hypothetical protein [Nonomuraea wenchangensis]|uniref:hypothetical protein n=1 Tax=Nonomuraea wenchangensis TaxID=568860 RepID=UPI0037A847A2